MSAIKNFGSSLMRAIRKVIRVPVVDEAAVKDFVKDIQRALLQADVNVKLVLEVSKRIEERALKEKLPPGISRHEHIVKVVYEELTKFLGEKPAEVSIKTGKPNVFMLVGIQGSGKCVEGNTTIPLVDGKLKKISSLFEEYVNDCSNIAVFQDGIAIQPKDLKVYSINPKTLKVEEKSVEWIWKLEAPEKLCEVQLDFGNYLKVTTTPEHPFFVNQNGEIQLVRADRLQRGQYVMIPSVLPQYTSDNSIDLLSKLKHNYVIFSKPLSSMIKKKLLLDFSTLKKAHQSLGMSTSYSRLTWLLKRGRVPIELVRKAVDLGMPREKINKHISYIRVNIGGAVKGIRVPQRINEEIAEFVGLLLGDGHLESNYVELTNSRKDFLIRFGELGKKIFGVEAKKLERDHRQEKLYRIRINSTTLVLFLDDVFDIPIGKKSQDITINDTFLSASPEIVLKLVGAYYDADSYAEAGDIELSTASDQITRVLQHIFLRIGIIPWVSIKKTDNRIYYRINVSSIQMIERFLKHIPISIKHKKNKLSSYINRNEMASPKIGMVPVGKMLKEVREKLRISVSTLQKDFKINSYGNYECMERISKRKLTEFICAVEHILHDPPKYSQEDYREKYLNFIAQNPGCTTRELSSAINRAICTVNATIATLRDGGVIDVIEDIPRGYCTTNSGLIFLEEQKVHPDVVRDVETILMKLRKLLEADVNWVRVKNVKRTKKPPSKYVYDLTVKDLHNFIANGIVIHNTTSGAKLARYFKKRGYKTALVCADTYRPGAYAQLKQLAEKINVPVYGDEKEKSPIRIADSGVMKFKDERYDLIIVDTAGRHKDEKGLIEEMKDTARSVKPDEIMLVVDATIGQQASMQAKAFREATNIGSIFVAKLDSSARGGGALSAVAATGAPIKFIGTGEKIGDIDTFVPSRFIGRLLGVGDVEALVRKVREAEIALPEKKAKAFLSGKFTLDDMYGQLEAMKRMGPLKSFLEMIPGMGQSVPDEEIDVAEERFEKWKYIIQSMTKEERMNPKVIDSSRAKRIARGSGTDEKYVKELVKQYFLMKKYVKALRKRRMPKQLLRMFSRRGFAIKK